VIAVDTNILVYAFLEDAPRHEQAEACLLGLANGTALWGLPVFCLCEFVRVVTHPRIQSRPATLAQAFGALEALSGSPSLRVLVPGPGFLKAFRTLSMDSDARGNLSFDAQIAAVCLEHGVTDILSEDRDFKRFSGLRARTLDDVSG